MIKNRLLLSLFLFLVLLGCSSGRKKGQPIPYNSNIEAFTSGKISRFSPVYLLFSRDVDSTRMTADLLKKKLRIMPQIEGSFAFENSRTIVFRPAREFKRNTDYTIKADLSAFFDVEPEEREFTFSFSTYGMALRTSLNSFDVNTDSENGYDLSITLFTPDREERATLESLLRFSEKVTPVWQQSPDGKKHEILLSNVVPGAEAERNLVLSVAPNKLDIEEKDLLSVYIPGMNDFSVYDINYKTEPERYVEVTFTQRLDEDQSMEGLAYIEGNSSELVNVSGNKLRLYPDAALRERKGSVNVHLSNLIRSKRGLTLTEPEVRQLTLFESAPMVRFVGEGVIIPQSEALSVPFEAIYLRGVVVRVIRIDEQNIGQFLQSNDLSGSYDLVRVGRIVARKTIFFDEEGADLTRWNTFAVDLNALMKPEPGAIYRVELSFDRNLSVYSCDADVPKATKEELLARDEIEFREETERFDKGWYSYYNENFDWNDYNYEEIDNPCFNSYYYNKRIGKNVLASNLGVIAKGGEGNEMLVMVSDLLTAQPQKGVEVTVYNYQHQPLVKGVTDEKGLVRLTLDNRKPYYLIATQGAQRSYLRVDAGLALSLSTFDVDGEVIQKGIKGFIYGERGVWRPGDTLHLAFMLNDREGNLPTNHPVVMELRNPLGQLYLRKTQTRGEMGLYAFHLPTDPDVPTGAWTATVQVGGLSFNKRVRIETIKPNRLKISLPIPEKPLMFGDVFPVNMHVEWLQGAAARDLKYDIQGTFISTKTAFNGYQNYVFDDPAKIFNSEESRLISGVTDGQGNTVVPLRFDLGTHAPGMLLANLVTRVYEESGDFSIDGARLLYSPYRHYVGIRPPQSGKEQLNTGQKYTYDVVTLNYDGMFLANQEVEVTVYKVYWYWWWSSDQSRLANYVSDSYNKPVKELFVRTDGNGKAKFELSFPDDEWGTYFVRVSDRLGKHSSGVMSYFDWPSYEGRRNRDGSSSPYTLTFKTDKDNYRVGEDMVISFPSTEMSKAIVTIENGTKVLSVERYDCRSKETTVRIRVTEEMQPNSYVYITLLQPHGETQNDLPIRLYGVVPFTVTSSNSTLHPVIRTLEELKPEERYDVTVSEKNGREMAYTVAIVDEGLLDLTRFTTPDPWKVFNAREALGVSTWDLYNFVVGTYGGRIEQLFSIGGDDALNKGPKAIVNRFKPVVRFEGPFFLKKGEKKRHTYKMPNYNGRVRMMIVAGDGRAYGYAEKSVLVRKSVMLLGTLPCVIGVGEEMVVPATVFATEKGVGQVQVAIECSGNMEVTGNKIVQLYFDEQGDKQAAFRIRVKKKPGVGHIKLIASGKGESTVYETDIAIRSVRRVQTKVIPATLENGKRWKDSVTMPGSEGTNKLTLEVSNVPPLNLALRLKYLLGYPHGCLEQILSKAFPQLYLNELVALTDVQSVSVETVIREVISRLRSYQTAEGAFAYWPGGTSTNAWGTAYAAHFLVEAELRGYFVPTSLKLTALNNLKLVARKWQAPPVSSTWAASEELTQAYRLYVLAQANVAEIGAMNRLKEAKFGYSASISLLASAYALAGRQDVATDLLSKTTEVVSRYDEYDLTFGSDLRDQAIRLQTLCLLDKAMEAAGLAKSVSEKLGTNDWFSTQSTSYALLAMSSYLKKYRTANEMAFTYVVDGKIDEVKTSKTVWNGQLLGKVSSTAKLEVRNTGQSTLFIRAIMEGIPAQGEETAYQNGLSLAVSYTDRNGKAVDIDRLEQGTNFIAVVTVRNSSSKGIRNVVLTEVFPAGWEILNTRFLQEDVGNNATQGFVNYQDIRDDRSYSYIDYLPVGRQVTVRIHLCAVYSGKFYLPPVYSEAMYDYLIRANTKGKIVEVY
ncbi:MAG: MG2 domain-containing protein [Massilibacteroides sp.]|nr:MG2 domain-containing protein [Massilibacteroides sp.]